MNIKEYNQIANYYKPKKEVLKHAINAFIIGGIIGVIGQCVLEFYQYIFNISLKQAIPYMSITMVFIASLLTAFGLYDRIANIAGAGSFIPITGFSNAMTACAMEGKSEGLVTGIGANIFKLAGAVLAFGIVSSFILGGIRYVFSYIW